MSADTVLMLQCLYPGMCVSRGQKNHFIGLFLISKDEFVTPLAPTNQRESLAGLMGIPGICQI